MGEPDPTIRRARYMTNPRQCVDCAGEPDAGRTRCTTCHNQLNNDTIGAQP